MPPRRSSAKPPSHPRSLRLANAARRAKRPHSPHSILSFVPRKNASRCAWRFINFECGRMRNRMSGGGIKRRSFHEDPREMLGREGGRWRRRVEHSILRTFQRGFCVSANCLASWEPANGTIDIAGTNDTRPSFFTTYFPRRYFKPLASFRSLCRRIVLLPWDEKNCPVLTAPQISTIVPKYEDKGELNKESVVALRNLSLRNFFGKIIRERETRFSFFASVKWKTLEISTRENSRLTRDSQISLSLKN